MTRGPCCPPKAPSGLPAALLRPMIEVNTWWLNLYSDSQKPSCRATAAVAALPSGTAKRRRQSCRQMRLQEARYLHRGQQQWGAGGGGAGVEWSGVAGV